MVWNGGVQTPPHLVSGLGLPGPEDLPDGLHPNEQVCASGQVLGQVGVNG
jgi:hypothetical protein